MCNAREEYVRYAKAFQKQFDKVTTPQLCYLIKVMADCDQDHERALRLFSDLDLKIAGEPMWSFMTSCTSLVVMTELELRRGVKPK